MDLATRLAELQKRTIEHREVLLTEEAAKTALIMPFLQALGYDVFNPAEVVPEYTADVGTKKGEKVDYAIRSDGKISILIECKPPSSELNINHASQLFRYFSVTDARLAILTNGLIYQFYSDVERPNKMDDKPFFTFNMEAIRPSDIKTIEAFTKDKFDIDKIVLEAGNLKLQTRLRVEIEKELSAPSDDFVRIIARRVYDKNITAAVKENVAKLMVISFSTMLRDLVNERLSSAISATNPHIPDVDPPVNLEDVEIVTTEEEISGFRIIQAISSRWVQPKRIVIRDAKAYCAILLDDNNRKTVARLHFNSTNNKYVGFFSGKEETRQNLKDITEIYQYEDHIEKRLRELDSNIT